MAARWNSELNKRRLELIDSDIQETPRPAEQCELANLTELMRSELDTEENFPTEGAKKLLQYLLGRESKSSEIGQSPSTSLDGSAK